MSQHTEHETDHNHQQSTGPDKKATALTIIFFALVFGAIFVVTLPGPIILVAVALVTFLISILYTYLA